MKKRIFSFFIVLLMTFFFFPTDLKTSALDLNGCRLYIGGKEVTNYNLSGEGWTFDPATCTITLNDFSYGTLGYYMGTEDIGHGRYRKKSIIYVDPSSENGLDLTIRSTGNYTNIIGDESYSENFYTFENGYATAYCGIYNPKGSVTITGSTDLIIGTQLTCIIASSLTVDTNSWVYAKSHTCSIDVTNMTAKGNGRVSTIAYCAESNTYGYNSTIYASRSVNVYDNAIITAEMYRDEECDNYAVNAIYAYTINARGGRISAKCYANGPKSTNGEVIDCLAILVRDLNISGGATVEGFVYNLSRKNYVGTVAVGHVYPSDSEINVQGPGVLRTGVQMGRPSSDTTSKKEKLHNLEDLKMAKGISCTTSKRDYRPKGFEDFDRYEEKVFSKGDGIYIRTRDGVQEWSYFRDFRKIEGSGKRTTLNPNLPIQSIAALLSNVDEIMANNPSIPVYILSGMVLLFPKADSNIQRIVVEGGTLNIRLSGGKKCTFTQEIEIKKDAKVSVDGDGIIEGLNVTGEGKIQFNGGTVTGEVHKPVDMIVDGGNIKVNYYDGSELANARNSKGQKVSSRMHWISSDKKYVKADLIRMNGRDYGSVGMYLFGGNSMYIWTVENNEVTAARATYIENGEYRTVSLYKTDSIYELAENSTLRANYSSLHTVKLGGTIKLHPLNAKNANVNSFNLVWNYSDDGVNWKAIDNPNIDGYGNLTLENVPFEYNQRQYRCEIYSKYENELLDVFCTSLYVYNYTLVSDAGFVDGKIATIRINPDIAIPDSLYFRSNWYVSKDGGNSFTFIGASVADISNKDAYPFEVEDYMDGWIIKCESIPHIGRFEFPEFQVATITINVTEKKPRIEEQPKGLTFDNFNMTDILELSVKARNATKYQWQVSKRNYLDNDVPFEDILGQTSSSYRFRPYYIERSMINYVYRCVVSNEYGEVITEEVYHTVNYKPLFSSVEDKMSVGIDGVASAIINIDCGRPTLANNLVWKVSRDGGLTIEDLSDEIMNGVEYNTPSVIMRDGKTKVEYYTFSMLEIENPTKEMNGWFFYAFLYSNEELICRRTFILTILSECQAHGHDWLPATCTSLSRCSREGCGATTGDLLPHTGGIATCTEKAKCEVCDSHYGELDPNNHTGTDKWNEEEWEYSSGHESTWSCCGKEKHSFENHKYHEGICTVCNYICSHELIREANCHERKHCYICGMDFAEIDPNNHDLSLGTYTTNKKDATCEEDGYTGDINCWHCMKCATPGTIIPAHGHDDSWPATCKEPAYCSICKKTFGDLDPNNHAEWSFWVKNDTTHEKHWNCCSMVTIEEHDFDENGICKICLYGCKHSGGTANCMEEAICEKCGDPYGGLDHSNHVGVIYYNYNDDTHTGICGCGEEMIVENHHWENGFCTICNCYCNHIGGSATCTEQATCSRCGEKYGDLNHDNHSGTLVWNRTSTTHSKKWSCCDASSGVEEEHTIVDEVCTICHYGCKHSGGSATCTEQATCSICNEKYGGLLSHKDDNHNHLCDSCNKVISEHEGGTATCTEQATCSICGEKYGNLLSHKDDNYDHLCDACNKVLSEHTGGSATCTEQATCNICGKKYGDLLSHNDNNHDHLCDSCNKVLSECKDDNHDHLCDSCNKTLSEHTGGSATCLEKATCSICGKKYGDLSAHKDDNHDHLCDTCERILSEHTGGSATCTEKATCSICGEKYGDLLSHKDDNHDHLCDSCNKILSEHTGGSATCTEQATCSICGKKYGDLLSHKDENLDHLCDSCNKVLSDCEDNNHDHLCDVCEKVLSFCKDDNHDHLCDICNKTLSEHSGGSATCTEQATCSICGEKYGNLLSHKDENYDHLCDLCNKTLSEHTGGTASCTEQATCSICGKKYGDLLSHNDGNNDHLCDVCEKVLSSCKDDNHDHLCDICEKALSSCKDDNHDHLCDSCNKTLSEHSGGSATCTEQATCSICGKKYGELDSNNHVHLKHVPSKEATVSEEGNIEYWYCPDCNKYYSDSELNNEITIEDTVIAKVVKKKNTSKIVVAITVPTAGTLGIAGGIIAYLKRKRKLL